MAAKRRPYDVSFGECSLCLFDNPNIALEEMYRVLKPGGRPAISDPAGAPDTSLPLPGEPEATARGGSLPGVPLKPPVRGIWLAELNQ